MKRVIALAAIALIASCSAEQVEITLKPSFAALLDIPDLAGDVIVRMSDTGEEIARASMIFEADRAKALLPGLPAGVDLLVDVEFRSGQVVIATSSEPKTVRLEKGKTGNVSFGDDDYVYPDDDGDGADNIFEVVYEADNPNTGKDAYKDPEKTPPGFFSGVTGAIALPGDPMGVSVRSLGSEALVATSEQSTGPVYSDHMVSYVSLGDRTRRSLSLDCDPGAPILDVKTNYGFDPIYSAALCAGQVHFIERTLSGPSLMKTVDVDADSASLAFGALGKRLYVLESAKGEISVLDSDPLSPTFGTLVATLDSTLLGEGARGVDMVDDGEKLIITDAGKNGLITVNHENGNYQGVGHPLTGYLNSPYEIVLHPSDKRAYVACGGSGKVVAVDTENPDPDFWTVVDEIDVGGEVSDLAIDPVHGSWLYAMSPQRIVRINTLTDEIEWSYEIGDKALGTGLLWDIAIAEDGLSAVATVGDARGMLVLGHPDPANKEREPNNELSALDGTANVVGPLPGSTVGWGDKKEQGSLTYSYPVVTVNGPVDATDDVEDVWSLDTTGSTGSAAIAVMPTDGYSRMNLLLMDANQDEIDRAVFPLGITRLSTGTGVFLVTPELDQLQDGLFLGIDVQDFGYDVNYSSYEIVVVPLESLLPEVAEIEPNNDYNLAQAVISFPAVVHGTAEASDAGAYIVHDTDDAEDCYRVLVNDRRLGVRLDFDAGADLDMYILNTDGSRIRDQYSLTGPGNPEFFIFEPYLQDPPEYLVCVDILEDAGTDPVDYTLTFVDFDM